MVVRVRRVYAEAADGDGYRVLVDRVWPRGVTKEAAAVDEWLKDVAPSTGLRKWFGHDPGKYEEFARRYERELGSGEQAEALDRLKKIVADHGAVTLVYGAKDEEHNQAEVLRGLL